MFNVYSTESVHNNILYVVCIDPCVYIYIYIVYIILLCPEWLGKSVMILLVRTRAATSIQVKVAVCIVTKISDFL